MGLKGLRFNSPSSHKGVEGKERVECVVRWKILGLLNLGFTSLGSKSKLCLLLVPGSKFYVMNAVILESMNISLVKFLTSACSFSMCRQSILCPFTLVSRQLVLDQVTLISV